MIHIPTKYGEDYCVCWCGCDLELVELEEVTCTYCINGDHLDDRGF